MRISDLSSDVCSSDLLRSRLAQGEVLEIAGYELAPALAESIAARKLPGILERLQELALAVLEVGATEEPSAATMRMLAAPGLDTGSQRARAVVGGPLWTHQTGRASCRERVCQYVKIRVDDVSLTKNK